MSGFQPAASTRRSSPRRFRWFVVAAVLLLAIAGCSTDEDPLADPSSSSTDAGGDTSSTTGAESTSTTIEPTTTSGSTETSDQTDTTDTTDTAQTGSTMLGEPFDGFAEQGDVLSVVGVAFDDELNLRAGPGTSEAIVATASPTDDGLVATGEARILESSIWYEVVVGGQTGWANIAFLAFPGGTDDATAEFLDSRERPVTETMVELGELVAAAFGSDDPPSDIVRVVAPTVGDLAEVTYDIVGIGDDAVLGYRLHIFASPDEGGEGFSLRSIERTVLCGRGVTGEACR